MAFIGQIIARIHEYMTPSRSRQRRSRPSPEPPLRQQISRLDRRTMSPTTRTNEWINRPLPTPSSLDRSSKGTPQTQGVKGSKITKQRLATPASSRKSARSWRSWMGSRLSKEVPEHQIKREEDEEQDLDGPTLVGDAEDFGMDAKDQDYIQEENMSDEDESDENEKTLVASSKRSRSKRVNEFEDECNPSDDEDEPSPTATKADASSIIPTLEDERKKRETALKKISAGGWADGEVELYQKLTMRGFEPLLPTLWAADFRTIPARLFASNEQHTLINSVSGNDFRAIKALRNLLTLGGRVRSKIESGRNPEEMMRHEMTKYIQWSHQDSSIVKKTHIPNIAIAISKPGQSTTIVEEKIKYELEYLAAHYRYAFRIHKSVENDTSSDSNHGSEIEEYSQPLLTLFGIVIAHSIVAFVTHDSANPEATIRSLGMFDFGLKDMDVWNSFAVAILIVQARNYLVGLRGQLEDGGEETDDPDA
ncbi:MAG: hypothetical protein M1812_001916 [Candelaria pacifica]|nr:MAG: hypothetical protein M1812_001916 [Candelaria pacifica]